MKNTAVLTVEFKTRKKGLLYEGVSWYRKGIEDHLKIAENKIILTSVRTGKIGEDFLFSPNSPARFQLYRAICFYLSVTGILPSVRRATFKVNKCDLPIDSSSLTQNWENCGIHILLDRDAASKCFTEKGKACYVAMTYFLKAQLDSFSNDCFRAAWSGLNALYNNMTDKPHEKDKLQRLAQIIREFGLPLTEDQVTHIDSDSMFWRRLQWHNYIQNKHRGKNKTVIQESLINGAYHDEIIFAYLSRYVLGEMKDSEQLGLQLKEIKTSPDPRERVIFLLTDYCYMLRNRSFHGEKPYPLFRMQGEAETEEEQLLTDILLKAICDLLANYDQWINSST